MNISFTAEQIAGLVQGTVEGNGSVNIHTFAKIEEGIPGAISFLSNPKYAHFLYSTKASAVLISNDFVLEHPVETTLIRVADPYQTLSQLLTLVQGMLCKMPEGVESPSFISEDVALPDGIYVGAFAYIGKGVKLGKNVKVFPQAYIGENVSIGDNTIIYPGVKIYHGCKIGNNCIIHAGSVIGSDGFGFAPTADGKYQKIPQIGIVEIHDNVEIGANTTIDRSTMGCTIIKEGAKLDNLIQVAHNVEIGENTVMAAQVGVAGSTKIGSHCMVGGQVGFAGHINIGDRTVIGAQSGIPNNVKSDSRIIGYPAVPEGQFARQAAYLKRIGQLFDRVDELEKNLKAK